MPGMLRRMLSVALAIGAVAILAYLPEMFPDHGMIRKAILAGDVNLARKYLDRGADPNSRRAILSQLRFTLFSGPTPGGTEVDFGVQDPLLTIAIQKGEFAIAKLLLERGADPNATDKQGYTPLCHAAISDNADIVRALLDRGADARRVMPDGSTALREGPEFHRRLRVANPESIALLKAAGLE